MIFFGGRGQRGDEATGLKTFLQSYYFLIVTHDTTNSIK